MLPIFISQLVIFGFITVNILILSRLFPVKNKVPKKARVRKT